jgi:hypothetical protein
MFGHPKALRSSPVGATGALIAFGSTGSYMLTIRRESLGDDGMVRTSWATDHYPPLPAPLKFCRGCGRSNAPWPWADEPWEKTHPLAEYHSDRCQQQAQYKRSFRYRYHRLTGYQANATG